ncbi:DEAD/DEAH box helicase [Pseudotabrizicola alkalilacus]|uniref:DUF1998 domain-containing protein n=1 Tax=Pseudotabrizicola alkalilacus TaxID=2305252 RepID=A0A411Z1Y0_9RHOB|nr:DEAD/DEAH box helicase [Pseudotabrizicola alkalilacus]RGP37074.1 DUF1998 domain-containing protein [Pseudotabrizicola alkalilacus]
MISATNTSNLSVALSRMTHRSASGIVSRARIADLGLNAALLQRLSVAPGHAESLLADPVFETAKLWKPAAETLGELSGTLLDPLLVTALDQAPKYRMEKGLKPYAHQMAAWRASLVDEQSVLITSGTGSGKTECFLIPILNDLLVRTRPGGGVQAILLYPLNALIESQRERLMTWAEGLGGRVRFALYNGDTPQTARKAGEQSSKCELKNRKDIRETPPDILVTNITMLEYLLLRTQDRQILNASQGALRWIVLDEAHSYVGSQAAEMALLLRRVRASFGVTPQEVRLMATSATIGGESNALEKLREFAAALAGQSVDRIAVIEGQEDRLILTDPGDDLPLETSALQGQTAETLWSILAPHPKLQTLLQNMGSTSLGLGEISQILFGVSTRKEDAQVVLDCAARAEKAGRHLLPWRAHVFHRAQGGVFACINAACSNRDAELTAGCGTWPFGALHLDPRPQCVCGAPVFEVVSCASCGKPHLQAVLISGAQPRFELPETQEGDDFALDAEPQDEDDQASAQALLTRAGEDGYLAWVAQGSAEIYENGPPSQAQSWQVGVIERPDARNCCADADRTRLQELRFGPNFFLGNALPQALEDLAPAQDKLGLPAGGRRAISFTDSRQGVARLAAKLQQDAERTLTRSFLWHAVQEKQSCGDPTEVATLQRNIERFRAIDADGLAEQIIDTEQKLARLVGSVSEPIAWPVLIRRFSEHEELRSFAGEIWQSRKLGGRLGGNSLELAQMFVLRELFRRPKVQNNPETMGFVRLVFPALERAVRSGNVPTPLAQVGVDRQGWLGLLLASVDSVFRDRLASQIPEWMVPIVSPRFGKLNVIMSRQNMRDGTTERTASFWPGPTWTTKQSRVQALVYGLINGTPDNPQDQDYAAEILDEMWVLITRHVARDTGAGRWQLDFEKAAVAKLDRAWVCPITRRPYGWSVAARSPYDVKRKMDEVRFPDLPIANAGGLVESDQKALSEWVETDPQIAELRVRGLWSDLHDRIATYPSFLRSQEHSAQIERPVLKSYEDKFNAGRINLLNCSTTMEMGVDLKAVQLVVNANVPPALSNYRQRVGRAGRQREAWAFGLTFCRDLPLDRQVFFAPKAFLSRPITAPKVWLESPQLVQRHVNAAFLAHWMAAFGGTNIKASSGSFFGAVDDLDAPQSEAAADKFLSDLRGEWAKSVAIVEMLSPLVTGTALEGDTADQMVDRSAIALEQFISSWRREYRALLANSDGATEEEVSQAFALRAKRMAGEFLLGDLARRGFTPAYGFATDVVTFDPLISGHTDDRLEISYTKRSGASRELHLAIREYAPGSEVVIDGLVYQSEGIRPAWGADADVSKLEDMLDLWECKSCHDFGISKGEPLTICRCGSSDIRRTKILRPTGFLTRKRPHTGYEALARAPFEPARVSSGAASWIALPDPSIGRYRHDPAGLVVSLSGGKLGGGFALCLCCGRAEPMASPEQGLRAEIPSAILRHFPLARSSATKLTHDGHCPGGYTEPHRIQRHIHLAQNAFTDVFELQLPATATEATGLAFAAAVREALAERLGVESGEIGVSVGPSLGASGEVRVSAWLHDRAAGGAGLVARLTEAEMLQAMIARAEKLLSCQAECSRGCPSCILQPDLSQRDIRLDRPGALDLVRFLISHLALPPQLQVFGDGTQRIGQPVIERIERFARSGVLQRLHLYLHGTPTDWDLSAWAASKRFARLRDAGVAIDVYIETRALTHAGLDLAVKLSLYRLAEVARIHHLPELPHAGGLSVVATLDTRSISESCAAASNGEATPGPDWGMGKGAPLVIGPMQAPMSNAVLSLERVMELGTGSGRILTPGAALDGSVKGFGQRFWRWLSGQAPLDLAAFQSCGVRAVSYSDRYLLTPMTMLLAAEVIRAVPGGKSASVRVDLAPSDGRRIQRDLPRVHDAFDNDLRRVEVLEALLPTSKVSLAQHRNDLPHRREMRLTLADGREFRLLLDQGFGAWRAISTTSYRELIHDWDASGAIQASALNGAGFSVSGGDEPIIWGKAP